MSEIQRLNFGTPKQFEIELVKYQNLTTSPSGRCHTIMPSVLLQADMLEVWEEKQKSFIRQPRLTSFYFSSIAFGGLNFLPEVHFVIVYFVNILINLLKDGLLFHFDPDMSYRVIIHDPKWVFWWCWKRWHVSVVWVVNHAYLSSNVFNIALIYNHQRQALVEI